MKLRKPRHQHPGPENQGESAQAERTPSGFSLDFPFFCPSLFGIVRVGKSGWRRRGVEFKGRSLHDGFGGFDGSGEHLALPLLVLQNTVPRDDHDGFDGFGGLGGCGGFGRDGYPP